MDKYDHRRALNELKGCETYPNIMNQVGEILESKACQHQWERIREISDHIKNGDHICEVSPLFPDEFYCVHAKHGVRFQCVNCEQVKDLYGE